ncbi:hypothetical protein RGQ15_21235 [Paracoccus sp. MBLB3053]|uniref:Uncharacterized protein n=1 Tax=Paracoccus aurantius TaxID=3073814 RepID=A0ABU2HZP6_9RHOB|nr:hypothetical protein [Paracoccus sp. MBLB3053]MDS9470079.1 hypothetical protein [Paracoccus sp. MBLB3053]
MQVREFRNLHVDRRRLRAVVNSRRRHCDFGTFDAPDLPVADAKSAVLPLMAGKRRLQDLPLMGIDHPPNPTKPDLLHPIAALGPHAQDPVHHLVERQRRMADDIPANRPLIRQLKHGRAKVRGIEEFGKKFAEISRIHISRGERCLQTGAKIAGRCVRAGLLPPDQHCFFDKRAGRPEKSHLEPVRGIFPGRFTRSRNHEKVLLKRRHPIKQLSEVGNRYLVPKIDETVRIGEGLQRQSHDQIDMRPA